MLKVVKGDGKNRRKRKFRWWFDDILSFHPKTLGVSWSGLTRMFFRRVGLAINQKKT